jgi:polysaccharide biosynthesis/export protein
MLRSQIISVLIGAIVAGCLFIASSTTFAQNYVLPSNLKDSPRLREMVRSENISDETVQEGVEAYKKGKVDGKRLEQYQKELDMGTLTPAEIEAGRKLFEEGEQTFRQQRRDRIYIYGNVHQPGEYQYVEGMRILDVLPSIDSFKKNTYFEFALIKRYHPAPEKALRKDGESDEAEVRQKDGAFYTVRKQDRRPSVKTTAAGDRQAELITFELGRLYFADDETQNLKLMPQDEIYIFSEDMIAEAKDKPDHEREEAPEDPFFPKTPPPEPPELEIFGHNLFTAAPTTFAPVDSVPISNDYLIGPGDTIRVLMWGRLDESHELTVDNEGVIQFPKIGPLTVIGLTFGELKELIRDRAEAITGVNVSISMGRLKTLQVFILGEVDTPGIYTVSSLSSIMNALLSAGGPTELGSLRRIQLKRRDQVVAALDLYDFLLEGDTSSDTALASGDVIFVPQAGPMVAVSGNVKREAIYELKDDRTLDRALKLAGGLSPGASNQRIQIQRASQNQSQVVLDITEAELRENRSVPLQDGDLIRVFSIHPEAVNAVYLYGNIRRPGQYAFKPGLRIRDVIPSLDSLKKETHYDYALIKRYRYEDAQAELIPFDLGQLLVKGDDSQNLPLMPRDEIYIFPKEMFEDPPAATVEGEIRNPGEYIIDDMTIRDLILKAGDLTPDAYMAKGELIRLDPARNRKTIYFDLAAAMANDPAHNHPVQNEDKIVIHSVRELNWESYVLIEGEVNNPGRYLLSQGMRLKDLFFKAGSFTRDAHLEIGHIRRTAPNTRASTIHTFNVEKAAAGDPDHNLLLTDMDEVTVHSIWDYREKYTVSIQGLVRHPGEYPYAENMTIKNLILLAGNVRDAAYMKEAELVRFSIVDGRRVETSIIRFDIHEVLSGNPDHNLTLSPLDVVTIKEIPDWWDKKQSVRISGEVHFPGTYQIRNDERLSDVIERAGGFTEYAYLRGAVFTRESVRKVQQSRLNEMLDKLELEIARLSSKEVQESLSEDDLNAQQQFVESQKALVEKLSDTRATGRVVVSLKPLEKFRSHSTDLALEGGDTLHVPKRPHTVNVVGAVHNPTALLYSQEAVELQHYLDLTGGPTDNADEDLMYIIRSDGTVVSKMSERSWWRRFESTELHPGDTILVPEKVTRTSLMRDTKDITQILYQIAVTAGITVTQIF